MWFFRGGRNKEKEEAISELDLLKSVWNIKDGDKPTDHVDPTEVCHDIYQTPERKTAIPPRHPTE